MAEAKADYLGQLNPPQKEGVVNVEGPCMIIAGAGSGKTRVLTFRIAHLIHEHHVDPFNIMALTFTNKAAREMQHRIESVAGGEAKNLWMGTFHSVFARVLRAEAGKIGYSSSFTIYDTDDSKSLIKQLIKESNLDDKLYKPNIVFNRISGAKNRLISWEEYQNDPVYLEDDIQNMRPDMGRLYKAYAKRCFAADAMDFDDLLFNTNKLFREHPEVLNKYQQRFHYVMIDEFQDTNLSQYLIARRLAAVRQNICVVGDDAQSIYAFRGADIRNILNFEKDYPDLKVIRMEQNYRSTQTIVNAANSVINKNTAQLKKSVWTDNQEGELIELIKATSDNEEGRLVASAIFQTKMQSHASEKEFAVLYRTNSQSRAIEEALRRNDIRYRVIGGVSFYQRKEIKDLLAYFRYVVNPNDEVSMRRIINLPKRGIGPGTIDKMVVAANEEGKSLWEVMETAVSYVGNRGGTQVQNFVTLIKALRVTDEKKDAYDTASQIAKTSGLLKELYDDKTIEGMNRYENTQELLNAIKEFTDNPEREDKSLGAFLQDVALLTDEDRNNKTDEAIALMTIHMAKGLEFSYVFIVGLEEDLFPSQMMLSSRADLEEERRLFYVAITRAKQKIFMSYALNRYRYGRLKNCERSRFLEEIAPQFIKVNRRFSSKKPASPSVNYVTKNFISSIKKENSTKKFSTQINHTPGTDFEPSDTSKLEKGMKVEHPKFGFGVVTNIDKQGFGKKASVDFEKAGKKTLLLSFAKLRILDE
ncbi:MAG: UvrD-helicase domain-containing protein [Ekhidna sp.]|nr:UvrD-helicase domain-containing protein [Ekhidna sp.]MBC6426392.1 UvrD-helicase domain-containing protein [Ekhidna sp.]